MNIMCAHCVTTVCLTEREEKYNNDHDSSSQPSCPCPSDYGCKRRNRHSTMYYSFSVRQKYLVNQLFLIGKLFTKHVVSNPYR